MRGLILALLIIPVSFALIIESTAQEGVSPVVYGEVVVYENAGNIEVYDFLRREGFIVGNGSNPSLFGFDIVFDSLEDIDSDGVLESVIKLANVRDRSLSTIGVGRHPFIFAGDIFFSKKESEFNIDINNDGDLDDDIVLFYDISSKS